MLDRSFLILAVISSLGGLARAEPITIKSKDATVQLTLPDGWEEAPADSPMRKGYLVPDSKVFARHVGAIEFAVAFREPEEDLTAKTLAEYVARVFKIVEKKSENRTVAPPTKGTVRGREALFYEIQSEHEGVKLAFIHTFMNGSKHWIQTVCWTTLSHKKDLDADCAKVNDGFAELK